MTFAERIKAEGLESSFEAFALEQVAALAGREASYLWQKAATRPSLLETLPSPKKEDAQGAFWSWVYSQGAPAQEEQEEASSLVLAPHILDRVVLEGKHFQAKRVLWHLRQGEYPLLWGSPGSGKTHLAQSIADEAGLRFVLLTLNPDSTKGEFLGNRSPLNGKFFPTAFYKAWKRGGLVLLDEIGMALGAISNVLNAALEQREILFPNGRRVKMHEHFFLVLADNSNLWGTSARFPERNDLGSAFRDRLSYVGFEYDEALELRILSNIHPAKARAIQAAVKACRAALDKEQVPLFAGPRFAFKAARALRAGFLSWQECLESYCLQGYDPEALQAVMPALLAAGRNL